ncbi:hypothetical protein D3C80_1472200 [compost metagenome]
MERLEQALLGGKHQGQPSGPVQPERAGPALQSPPLILIDDAGPELTPLLRPQPGLQIQPHSPLCGAHPAQRHPQPRQLAVADAPLHSQRPEGLAGAPDGHPIPRKAKGAQGLAGREAPRQKLPQPLGGRTLQAGGQRHVVGREAGGGKGGGIEADAMQGQGGRSRQQQVIPLQKEGGERG